MNSCAPLSYGPLTSNQPMPCMNQLDRFTKLDVPTMGPAEIVSSAGRWTNSPSPAGLPGKGLAQHSMLYVGENYTKMFLVNEGKVTWTYQTGPGNEFDDVWMLSNGNILYTRMQYLAEITPDKKVVWRYDCDNSTGTNHTEVHTCQPIGLDRVMLVLNGLPPRLMIVNIKTGRVEVNREVPSADGQPFNPRNIHGQFRRARYTAQGTYLISYLSSASVVEYDKDFKKIWSYPIRSPWAAIRLRMATRSSLMNRTASRAKSTPRVRPSGNSNPPNCRKHLSLPTHHKLAHGWQTATPSSLRAAAMAEARNWWRLLRTKKSSGCCITGRRSEVPPPCKSSTTPASRKSRVNRNIDSRGGGRRTNAWGAGRFEA